MTEEEEKAIERLEIHKEYAGLQNGTVLVNKKDVETVLNLIQKQKEEIEKKDKIIQNQKKALKQANEKTLAQRRTIKSVK